jgi:hypothetical protein
MRSTLTRTSHVLFILGFHCCSLLISTANHREILKPVATHLCGEDIHHRFCFTYITWDRISLDDCGGLGGIREYSQTTFTHVKNIYSYT